MGIKEANWLLVEIAYIIKIINYNTKAGKWHILSLIYHEMRNAICLEIINSLAEKYGKFNNAMYETERENLFIILENQSIKLLFSG